MRIAILALMLVALAAVVSAADVDCSMYDLCYNQNDLPFCSATDSECTYRVYGFDNVKCTATNEEDTDGDGWSDTCDAFPNDESEWIDYDADGVGHNKDCDDLDENVQVCEAVVVNKVKSTSSSTEQTETVSRNGGSGGCWHDWECTEFNDCVDGTQSRTCKYVGNCEHYAQNPPVESQECEVVSDDSQDESEFVIVDDDTIVDTVTENKLTGLSVDNVPEQAKFPWYIMLLLGASVWWYGKRDDAAKPF